MAPPRGLHLLKEGPQREGELNEEGGGMLPGEALDDTLEHRERLHHDVVVQGVAAAQHVGLEDAELSHLPREGRSGDEESERSLLGTHISTRAGPQTGASADALWDWDWASQWVAVLCPQEKRGEDRGEPSSHCTHKHPSPLAGDGINLQHTRLVWDLGTDLVSPLK